ncbi:MAG: RNA 2'-phosphotransferase [Pseudomonadota bacterium]
MKKRNSQESLAKMLAYILGRNPEEFGLVPDANGYVKIKDLLKAICEEEGWRHVRRSHLDEVVLVISDPPIEMVGLLVRATNREHLSSYRVSDNPPAQLFLCVRKKAYPVVLEKGVSSSGHPFVVLSDNPAMAQRLGRRFAASPVLLTVSVPKMLARGIEFLSAGGSFYLVGRMPPDCFTGPPLAKTREETKSKEAPSRAPVAKTPGSFMLEISNVAPDHRADEKREKKQDWKRERKRMNRRGQGKGEWE